MKVRLNNSTRHHALGLETINFTVVDDKGEPVPGAKPVTITAPDNFINLSELAPTAIYVVKLEKVEPQATPAK